MSSVIAPAIRVAASLWLAAGTVALADPALAASYVEPAQAQVQTADLNLASPAGRATAAHRIRTAAASVCATDGFSGLADHDCMTKAVADAQRALTIQVGRTSTLAAR